MPSSTNAATDGTDRCDRVDRRVQLTGESTYAVSLPKSWAVEQHVERGDTLHIYPQDDRLVVATAPVDREPRTTRILARHRFEETVERRFRTAYLGGADEIVVSKGDADVLTETHGAGSTVTEDAGTDTRRQQRRRAIRSIVEQYIGFQIVEESHSDVVCRDVLNPTQISLPQAIARMCHLVLPMYRDAISAVCSDDDRRTARVVDRADDVDRLFAFVSRGVHRGVTDVADVDWFGLDRTGLLAQYRTARNVERVADSATRIAAITRHQDGPPPTSLVKPIEATAADACDVVDLALAAETERAIDRASVVEESCEEIEAALRDRAGAENDPDVPSYALLVDSVRRTANLGINVLDASTQPTSFQ